MSESEVIKVGSRKSKLAMIQTNFVINRLKELHPHLNFEIESMDTIGDKELHKSLPKIGEKSLFTAELEIALKEKRVDFAVHSLKDLPTTLPEGLVLGAVCRREDARDVVLLNGKYEGKKLKELPERSVIGTSSLRRTAQLRRNYPQFTVENIRGNLETRFRKLTSEENSYAAIILASAGVKRMGWLDRIGQVLDGEEMLFAVGQGALGVECRENDPKTLSLLESLHDFETVCCVIAERSFLRKLEGGCSAPVGVYSKFINNTIQFVGAVWSLNGKKELKLEEKLNLNEACPDSDETEEPKSKLMHLEKKNFVGIAAGSFSLSKLAAVENFGEEVANTLIKRGASEIMSEAKDEIKRSIAVGNSGEKVVNNLIKHGASINVITAKDETKLSTTSL
ncbi:unnamed protein product [Bemisia tabaci]|uniref:hydroxymethylbilane synthase n=2 Tax=Bemisia tabaci TaxID=7038 RepID=A0A9P0F7W3_BEMTA|nr:unnamed protein product [Bemisia tabaci]